MKKLIALIFALGMTFSAVTAFATPQTPKATKAKATKAAAKPKATKKAS